MHRTIYNILLPATGWQVIPLPPPCKECTGVRYIITKFSSMDSWPNFLTHGAPLHALRARELPYYIPTPVVQKLDESHEELTHILSHLDHHGLQLHLSKCQFMHKLVTYMGCVISASGISPTEEKVEAIKQAPRSKNLTQLRAFLRMVNWLGLSETWALSSNHSLSFSSVTKNSSGPPCAKEHLKRPRTHSDL